jgi:hypothetical protein
MCWLKDVRTPPVTLTRDTLPEAGEGYDMFPSHRASEGRVDAAGGRVGFTEFCELTIFCHCRACPGDPSYNAF